jgi:large subunit ribosomal protein L22
MEVRAVTKYAKIAPQKARQVARLLQGKKAAEALGVVELIPRKAARLMEKTLCSAIANAENNYDLDKGGLIVKEAIVGAGPTMRRYRAKARGMAGRIRKRTSHLTIVLSNE